MGVRSILARRINPSFPPPLFGNHFQALLLAAHPSRTIETNIFQLADGIDSTGGFDVLNVTVIMREAC
jgi:hypothetical protein